MNKVKTASISTRQKEVMLDFISQRREMYTGKFTPSYTREKMKSLWLELTNNLNSIPGGGTKDWKQWRKCWVDLKKNTKAKLSQQKKHCMGTGGGPSLLTCPDNMFDEKMLDIITPVAISGNSVVGESQVTFYLNDELESMEELETEVHNTVQLPACDIEITDCLPSTSQQKGDASKDVNVDYLSGTACSFDEKNEVINKDVDCPAGTSHNSKGKTLPVKRLQRRITKSARLKEGLKTNTDFLNLFSHNSAEKNNFYTKRLELMERDIQNRERYYNSKLVFLSFIAEAAQKIAASLDNK